VLVESYTVGFFLILLLFLYTEPARQLPDGRTIKVGSERFEAPECMFQPHLVDIEQPGVAGTFLPVHSPLLYPTEHAQRRDVIPSNPNCPRRRPHGALQTRRPLRWIKYVPRSSEQVGEGDEAALFDEGVGWGSDAVECKFSLASFLCVTFLPPFFLSFFFSFGRVDVLSFYLTLTFEHTNRNSKSRSKIPLAGNIWFSLEVRCWRIL
jgi:hypothetical protein